MSRLSESLRAQLIPWSQHNAGERFIIVRSKMSAAQMPDGIILKRRKIVGARVIEKNRRYYGNVRSLMASWPDAGLGEWANHKMVCPLAGQLDFQVGHYSVNCGAGFFLIVPPGTPQPDGRKLHYHSESTFCEVLHIVLHQHAVQCFITRSQSGQNRVQFQENYLFKSQRLAELFRFLMEELIENGENSHLIGGGLFAVFLQMLQREIKAEHYINPGPLKHPAGHEEKQEESNFKTDLLNYVQTHLNQSLTLESVAHGLYMSRTQFIRRVREETGKTFVQFLTDYRVAEAKVLLRDSDWTITAIADFLGFKESTYFQTIFRRCVGKTPGNYRANVKSKL